MNSIFEDNNNSNDQFDVIEGNMNNNNITTIEQVTAGNISNNEPIITDGQPTSTIDPIHKSKPFNSKQLTSELLTTPTIGDQEKKPKSKTNANLLWSWIHENCVYPFTSSFKGQFVAEALQVTISAVPVIVYSLSRRPYTPCQDLPDSAFIDKIDKKLKKRKKSWKNKIFSLESFCILCLAAGVFMAGFLDNNDGSNHYKNNEFKHYRNNNNKSTRGGGGRKANNFNAGFSQRKYGAYY